MTVADPATVTLAWASVTRELGRPALTNPWRRSQKTVAKSCPGSFAAGRTTAANGAEDRIGQSQRLTHTFSAKEVEMHRYRLTFDPNAKELARRDSAGTHVALLWSRRRHHAAVVLEEDATGELVELDIHEGENPLELYQHPYAYLTTRGHPGKRSDPPSLVATRTAPHRTPDPSRHNPKEVSPTAKKEHKRHELRRGKARDQ
jgi:hypothetical protein